MNRSTRAVKSTSRAPKKRNSYELITFLFFRRFRLYLCRFDSSFSFSSTSFCSSRSTANLFSFCQS